MREYQIHGDNIVECERTLELIVRALDVDTKSALRPVGSPLTPTYTLATRLAAEQYCFTFLPGYGRWDVNILEVIRRRGGRLREAADAIICRVERGFETPLLAIEYCGALPAGNQAWQRNGRALSFSQARLPYMYIAELSGYELDSHRGRKAARMPNPAVPFSYLLLTELTKSPTLPVFVRSPGASAEAVKEHGVFYGEAELLEIIRCVLLDSSTEAPRNKLEAKVLGLVKYLANTRRAKDTLPAARWAEAYKAVCSGEFLTAFLVREEPIAWSKTAYIQGLTTTAKAFMATTSAYARGLTSASLPLCVVAEKQRKEYARAIKGLYPAATAVFLNWCRGPGDLTICWVMGFKPRGDDARPDRGLPPLCRMLIGDGSDLLTVVYGPAPKSTWSMLARDPAGLMEKNGLWESVMVCSDAIMIDSKTLPSAPPLGYLKTHWASAIEKPTNAPFRVTPVPKSTGENDVDTVLHLLFARYGHPRVFEGMCNPPGGDWSGLSLQSKDRKREYRWLVLPRVTAKGSKRPDHVFQLFDSFAPFLVLAVESKELASAVEEEIGPRLTKYVRELVESPPSVERTTGSPWGHHSEGDKRATPQILSAAAFAASDLKDLSTVGTRGNVDLVFGVVFAGMKDSCQLHVYCRTALGKEVGRFLASLSVGDLRLTIKVHS